MVNAFCRPNYLVLSAISLCLILSVFGCKQDLSPQPPADQQEPPRKVSVQSVLLHQNAIGDHDSEGDIKLYGDQSDWQDIFEAVLADSFGISAVLDTAYISAFPNTDSVPYLVFVAYVGDTLTTVGLMLEEQNSQYYPVFADPDNNSVDRKWECKNTGCSGPCTIVRQNFMAVNCICPSGGLTCEFTQIGGGTDWLEVGISVLALVIGLF